MGALDRPRRSVFSLGALSMRLSFHEVVLAAVVLTVTACASRPPGIVGAGDFYDPKNPNTAEPPKSWRADSPNGVFWINVFVVKDDTGREVGYRMELFPRHWLLGRQYLRTSTLIPIEPGVSFTWRDDTTLIVMRGGREFLRLANDVAGSPREGWKEVIGPNKPAAGQRRTSLSVGFERRWSGVPERGRST